MPELVDPTDSLISFQYAFSNGLIEVVNKNWPPS